MCFKDYFVDFIIENIGNDPIFKELRDYSEYGFNHTLGHNVNHEV